MPNTQSLWSRVSSLLAPGVSSGVLVSASLVASLSGCADEGSVGARPEAVVYGEDDRTDVYAHPSASLRSLATESIVALVPGSDLTDNGDGTWDLASAFTLEEAFDLCDDQRFLTQPTSAFCSGTLVAPDVIVTAGHCMESMADCLETSFVFDYLYTADGVLAELEDDDVYNCAEILAQENGVIDYAYLRLDRPVVGHTPATLSAGIGDTCRNVEDGEAVTVLGFGSGLPLKIDDGGNVTDPSTQGRLLRDLARHLRRQQRLGRFNDAGELVGVLSAGAADYVTRDAEGCDVVNVLPESAGGEVIGHVLPTLADYCADAPDPDADLCALFDTACPNGVDGEGPAGEGSSCSVSSPAAGTGSAPLAFLALLGLVLGRRVRRRGSAE
ncbi:MAG: trypsin-like peptidase domain-containing protein [Sandaracinaceae bacterium]|nr:trypsin-like peptidase domain-containing protein [Sandaracinaceae bacterium]